MRVSHPFRAALVVVLTLALGALAPAAGADPGLDDGIDKEPSDELGTNDPSASLDALDAATTVVSDGPSADVIKNLEVAGRGERLAPNATTDVWAHRGFAYVGTFNDPCGTGNGYREDTGPVDLVDDREGPGVPVFNVRNVHKPTYLGNLPSVEGSRVNDVKVARMNSGDILVHSNEACAGGDGGYEVYDVSDPANPVHLAAVRVAEANEVLRDDFAGTNLGVHNLFLFTQGSRDYVAMQTHAWFGSFQIHELTDPTNPELVSAWGAEFLCEEDYCSDDPHDETDADTLVNHINGYMFCGLTPCYGSSQNRFLHDMTISEDGTDAYLASWDAGLILLDIADPADPQLVSVALDPTAGDGEVNSHAVWPTEDGSVVVETEEDFDAIPEQQPLDNWTVGEAETNTIPAIGISTAAGDDFEDSQTDNVVEIDLALAHHLLAPQVAVVEGELEPNVYAATEASGDQPKLADTGAIGGEAVWIGRACDIDPLENEDAFDEGDVAMVRRGECPFTEKLANAADLGASAVVVANNLRGDSQWGNVRIWDYSDPANPVLASEFDTVCSKSPTEDICDVRGTYSVHNVVVEKDKAYLSWYSDGVLILDISDPSDPVEVARYNRTGEEFEEANGGIQDVWGIWKERGRPWLYASDRNGGLYVLKEYGAGSAGKGKPRP